MANREACELYIEQEIMSGLEAGKKPWTIGKELAGWIEKLFEVKMNPRTIEKRADRILEQNSTNVENKSNIETKPIVYKQEKDSITHPISERGGARENAGRKKILHTETYPVSEAMIFAKMAICQLERIMPNDPEREAALDAVVEWIKKQGRIVQ